MRHPFVVLRELPVAGLVVLTGCITVAPPPVATSAVAESRLVMVVGERADALGWTTSAPDHGMVHVRMHDGRDLVVREQAIAAPWLEAGRWVLRRTGNGLEPAEIVSGLDAFLEVRPRGAASLIIPIGEVVGILHEAPSAPTPPPPPVAVIEPLRGHMSELVELGETPDVRAARAISCAHGVVHVVFAGGTEADVPEARVRDLRLVVGQPVTAFWEGTVYPAHVVALRSGEARIAWDDGSDSPEQWVQLAMLDRIVGPLGARGQINACRNTGPVAVEVGQRVRLGRLVACEGNVRVVQGRDGFVRLVEPQVATHARVGLGDTIEALWNHQSPYPAQVMSIGERVHVRWEDGSESDVDPADLLSYVRTEDRPSTVVSCPAPPPADGDGGTPRAPAEATTPSAPAR
ncbi:MAG: hypothetical protein K1X94_22725 [Sandaracinaceae bacterium]|nr:hypothetical protein [Sandaracinaceae bacterium]